MDDLETALSLLLCLPTLFERLEKTQRAKLLQLLVKTIVVNYEGRIKKIELHQPVAFLGRIDSLKMNKLSLLTNSPLCFSSQRKRSRLQGLIADTTLD